MLNVNISIKWVNFIFHESYFSVMCPRDLSPRDCIYRMAQTDAENEQTIT